MNKLNDNWYKKFWPYAKPHVWVDAHVPIKTSINKLFSPFVLITYEAEFEDGLSVFWSMGRYNFQAQDWFTYSRRTGKQTRVKPLKMMVVNNPHVVNGYPTE